MVEELLNLWSEYQTFVQEYYGKNPQEIMDSDREYSLAAFMTWLGRREK